MKNNTLVPANLEALIDKYGYCVFDINLSNKKEPTEPLATQYNIMMMCYSGEMTIEANMRTITIKKGDCLPLLRVKEPNLRALHSTIKSINSFL